MKLRKGPYADFLGCSNYPLCDVVQACTPDGRPLGPQADKETRVARQALHLAFDAVWKNKKLKRKEAYAWLAQAMGLTADEAHIRHFSKEQCQKALALVAQTWG